jgi:hypothetical protein
MGARVGTTSGGQHGSVHSEGIVSVPMGQTSSQAVTRSVPCVPHGVTQPLGFGPRPAGQNTLHVKGLVGPGLPSGHVATIRSTGADVGRSVGGTVGLNVGD